MSMKHPRIKTASLAAISLLTCSSFLIILDLVESTDTIVGYESPVKYTIETMPS